MLSVVLFATSIVMYLFSVIPSAHSLSIHLIYKFIELTLGLVTKFTSLPTHQLLDPVPRTLRHATIELASSNLICAVALTGVLALQAGRFWAESSDNDDDDEYEEVEVAGTRSGTKTPDLRSEKPVVFQRINDTS